MQIHWQLRRSPYCIGIIIVLGFLPLGLSLALQHHGISLFFTLLSPLLLFLMMEQLKVLIVGELNNLSWCDGIWVFSNPVIVIRGKKSKRSFAVGSLIFLSIKDVRGRRVELWLMQDSILDTFNTGFIPRFPSDLTNKDVLDSEQGFRHLHSCFYMGGSASVNRIKNQVL